MNKLDKVAKDMIDFEFPDKLVKQVTKLFYQFCRDHNIKHGTAVVKDGKIIGYNIANAEWVICEAFFFQILKDAFTWSSLIEEVPDDLKG